MTEDAAEMSDGQDGVDTILRRKMSVGRSDERPAQDTRVVLRALRRALARAAEDICELPLAVIGAKQIATAPEALTNYLADDQLLLVLDGPGGIPGAIAMDNAAVTAIIQQQTMGQVSGKTAADRGYTGTDAAMIAPLVDAMLTRAEINLTDTDDLGRVQGFRFGARVDDVRSLTLLMEMETYLVFDLTLDLAVGRLQGRVCLILPDIPVASGENDNDEQAVPDLSSSTGVVRAELSAVLTRLNVSLEELMSFRSGDLLPLAAATLNGTAMTAIDGKTVAFGRLGQAAGARAVRLHATGRRPVVREGEDAEFAAHIGPVDVVGPQGRESRVVKGGETREQNKLVTIETAEEVGMGDLALETGAMETVPSVGAETSDLVTDTDPHEIPNLPTMTPEQVAAEISELAGLEAMGTEN